jgi:transglutaminase-like putative cysteine protease
MRERALLLAGFVLVGAWHWSRLEQPAIPLGTLLGLGLLAALPAVPAALGRARATLLTLAGSLLVAIGTVAGAWPFERHHPFFLHRLWIVLDDGIHTWFQTRTPFDPARFHTVDVEVRLGFYLLALVLAFLLLPGGRRARPLVAVAVAFAMVALPSTVVPLDRSMLRAALFLALALALLWSTAQGARPGARLQGAVLTLLVVAAGLVLGQAPGVTKAAFLDWQRWDPLRHDGPSVSVSYVWDQDYGPLHWPKKKTVVFDAFSAQPHYWRAAVLNQFIDDHWQASSQVLQYGSSGTIVSVPPSQLPPKARGRLRPSQRTDVRFHIRGLADDHLLSAGQPLQFEVPGDVRPTLDSDGTLALDRDVARDASYTVRGYVPDPSPGQLSHAGNHFPEEIVNGLQVNGQLMPIWPRIHAFRVVPPLTPDYMRASNRAWAESKAGEATSEYGAVVALEGYLRAKPFVYDQTPGYKGDLPPLVDFLTRSHRGYCQMFSGAMALVLRLHGIPARVAVGFTTGTQNGAGAPFVVTDHDAHSWVEVYFPGYGWLPFDPTKTRFLPERYSTANPAPSQPDAASLYATLPAGSTARAEFRGKTAGSNPSGHKDGAHQVRPATGGRGSNSAGGGDAGAQRGSGTAGRLFMYVLWIAVVVAALLAAAKAAAVRWRYLRRDPRARVEAVFRELVTFVSDQGLRVPPSTTVVELAEQVKAAFGVDISAFAAEATVARYAPPALAAPASAQLRRELRRVKREIRGELSRWERASGAFRLRAAFTQPA